MVEAGVTKGRGGEPRSNGAKGQPALSERGEDHQAPVLFARRSIAISEEPPGGSRGPVPGM
eukprot:6618499-Lingulodinium_polyedra.AAC.1